MSITSSTMGKRTFKVILLGDTSTGKTSIIERFVNNRFEEKDNPTIGIDFLGKNVTHNSTTCRLQLWDTAGQERYRSLIPSYLKDAVCAIFVFDLSRPETLQNLASWIDLFRDNRGQKTVMAVCGNKSDLSQEFDGKVLNQLLQKHKMKYYEVSALNGNNVEIMFFAMIDEITILQQVRRKKALNDDEDINPPLTTENLRSQRLTTKANDTQSERQQANTLRLKKQQGQKGWKLCCF